MVWQRAALVSTGASNRRQDARTATRKAGVLLYDGTQIPVVVTDISKGGARADVPARLVDILDDTARLQLPGVSQVPVAVRWRSSANVGLAFDLPENRKTTLAQQIARLTVR